MVAVVAEPSSVRWTLAPGLGAMWLGHKALVDRATRFATDRLKRMPSWRGAMAKCGLAAYNQAGKFGELLASNDPGQQFFLGIGFFASVTECGDAVRQARREAEEAHVYKGKGTTLTEEVSQGVDEVLRV